MQIAGVELTHPDKVYYPSHHTTKLEVAKYYERAAEFMLPFLKNRPATLVRSIHGVQAGTFYQRHPGEYFPDYIERVKIHGKEETEIYITLDALEDLIYLVNQGVLEFHAWASTDDDENHPDQIVWDLDPGENTDYSTVVTGALLLKEYLEDRGLKPFAKLSGSKGIHVVLPIKPDYTWDHVKKFSLQTAQFIAENEPSMFTTELPKLKRVGKVFIDYLRNSKGATAVSPFSLRAKNVPAAAVPICWDEVDTKHLPNMYLIDKLDHSQLQDLASEWSDFWKSKQSLPDF